MKYILLNAYTSYCLLIINNYIIVLKIVFVSSLLLCTAVGLFPSEDSIEQMAFELAIHKVNLDPTLSDVKLEGRVEIVDIDDGYQTSKKGKRLFPLQRLGRKVLGRNIQLYNILCWIRWDYRHPKKNIIIFSEFFILTLAYRDLYLCRYVSIDFIYFHIRFTSHYPIIITIQCANLSSLALELYSAPQATSHRL